MSPADTLTSSAKDATTKEHDVATLDDQFEDLEVADAEAHRLELERAAIRTEGTGAKVTRTLGRIWTTLWPKILAIGIALAIWEGLYVAGWKPDFQFASPAQTLSRLGDLFWSKEILPGTDKTISGRFWSSAWTTLQRGLFGFAISLVIGTILGLAVSHWKVLRSGIGSMISGLQTMPSIAWFPFALLIFGLSEQAIYFVILMGAVPSIANGIINGIDDVPPQLMRAGHMLGARGFKAYRYVMLPAALPSYVSGLVQGWAFAWRGLLAGELLVPLTNVTSLGSDLNYAGQSGQPSQLMALMIVILIIGMVADFVFSSIARKLRERRGLTGFTAAA